MALAIGDDGIHRQTSWFSEYPVWAMAYDTTDADLIDGVAGNIETYFRDNDDIWNFEYEEFDLNDLEVRALQKLKVTKKQPF